MITYSDATESLTADELEGFFEGWQNPPSPEVHMNLLKNSDHVILACDDETGRVVGFVTAISDGVLSAYIPFLEVLPEYRGRGADAIFYVETARAALAQGYKRMEGSWILETNTMMNLILQRLGMLRYKSYRVYEKPL